MPESSAALKRRGVDLPVPEIIDRLVAHVLGSMRVEIPWQPGTRELLADLAEERIPCALVTQAFRPVAELVARNAHPAAFVAIVAGDDVAHGKPHPSPT